VQYSSIDLYVNATYKPETVVIVPPGQLGTLTPYQLRNAFIKLFVSWTATINRISSYDPNNGTLRILHGPPPNSWGGALNRYQLMNVDDVTLLRPGEFTFDPTSRNITYRALAGEDPRIHPLIAPRLSTVLNLNGSAAADQWLEHVSITGLTVRHTAAFFEEQCMSLKAVAMGCNQILAGDLTTAAIELGWGVRDVNMSGLEVAAVGGWALWMHDGTHNTSLTHSHLHDLGAGGVRVGQGSVLWSATAYRTLDPVNTPMGILLSDNVVEDGSKTLEHGGGIRIHQARNVTISHNVSHRARCVAERHLCRLFLVF